MHDIKMKPNYASKIEYSDGIGKYYETHGLAISKQKQKLKEM